MSVSQSQSWWLLIFQSLLRGLRWRCQYQRFYHLCHLLPLKSKNTVFFFSVVTLKFRQYMWIAYSLRFVNSVVWRKNKVSHFFIWFTMFHDCEWALMQKFWFAHSIIIIIIIITIYSCILYSETMNLYLVLTKQWCFKLYKLQSLACPADWWLWKVSLSVHSVLKNHKLHNKYAQPFVLMEGFQMQTLIRLTDRAHI